MKFVTARDLMTSTVITVTPDTSVIEAMDRLVRLGISGMPVVDEDGALVGIITEYDCMQFALSGEAREAVVSEAMTRDVISFPPDAQCPEIANCFAKHRIRRVPIVEDGKVVGIVSRRDILRQIIKTYGR